MDLVTDLILNKKIRKTPDIDFGVTCVNIPVHLPAPIHVHIHIHTERGSGERSSKAYPSSQHSLISPSVVHTVILGRLGADPRIFSKHSLPILG